MPTQEIQTITKETQKVVLKTICESPVIGIEELVLLLNSRDKKISKEEVIQVLHSISPGKNWHRTSQEDMQTEVLDYLWTLENQILFLLPAKQKETTVAEFNQIRLQNKQSKVSKDLIRHLQTLLFVESKNLSKFRKFVKDLSVQGDVDPNIQAVWLLRILLAELDSNSISSNEEIVSTLINNLKERSQAVSEKVGKTIQRITERFVEKYFPKNISVSSLKELISKYQSIYHSYEAGGEREIVSQGDFQDQNKLIQGIVEHLKEAQAIVNDSHEGGFLSKLLSGKVKNKEGVIKKIDDAIALINQLNEVHNKANKSISEKVLLVQKLQSDYENIVLVKSQLENDLYNLKENLKTLEEKHSITERELHDKTESLEKAHEKIAVLQQKADHMPEMEGKISNFKEELNTAKDLAVRLYSRLNKIKADLVKQLPENKKNYKLNGEQKNGTVNNITIHKIQQNQETGETTVSTEISQASN